MNWWLVETEFDLTEEQRKMKRYVVTLTNKNGEPWEIDYIAAPEGYTAEQYVRDCEGRACEEWMAMLREGTVTLSIDRNIQYWWLVDDNISAGANIWTKKLFTDSKEDALRMARLEWESMSEYDRKRRDAFYIALAPEAEDGDMDFNEIEESYNVV